MMKVEKNWREWEENIKIHNRDCQRSQEENGRDRLQLRDSTREKGGADSWQEGSKRVRTGERLSISNQSYDNEETENMRMEASVQIQK